MIKIRQCNFFGNQYYLKLLVSLLFGTSIFYPLNAQILGAELYATINEPGKLKITLQTFYKTSQAEVPQIETVSLFDSKYKAKGQSIELVKESEFIDVKYSPIEGAQISTPPSARSVVYTRAIDLVEPNGRYEITWAYAGVSELLNNIIINNGEALALKVHVADSAATSNNQVPVLGRLPVIKVSSREKTISRVDIADNDPIDKVDVVLSAPLILDSSATVVSKPGSILTGGRALKKAEYRKGFSPQMPAAQSFSYDKDSKEFVLERPAFGNYVIAITITDYRYQTPLSQHQAVFIIESIL